MRRLRTFVRSGGGVSLLNKLIKPKSLLVLLMFLVLSVSIGYSSLTTSLNITGLVTKVRQKAD
ncbi:MAG: hypothetical protein IJY25_01885, partial [Bacilli bacterium]|nr:hypothetical protein [Bacilli bacterium]